MVHIDRGGDNATAIDFYTTLLGHGVSFDVIGLSYYPFWHGPLPKLQQNLTDLGPRFGKEIVVVETAYPWTFADPDGGNVLSPGADLQAPYPATPAGQLGFLRNLLEIVKGATGGYARGVVYWEPDWIPGVGWEPGGPDQWDNLTLFDYTGRALSSVMCFEGER